MIMIAFPKIVILIVSPLGGSAERSTQRQANMSLVY